MDFSEINVPDPPDPPDPSSSQDGASDDEGGGGGWLQILANYATLLVAVSAVLLSVWQGYEMRTHNRLSVLPRLEAEVRQLRLEAGEEIEVGGTIEQVDEPTFVLQMRLENRGLGPAAIRQVRLYRAGTSAPLHTTQQEGDEISLRMVDSLWSRVQNRFPEMEAFTGGVGQGGMIRAGEGRPFLEAGIPTASVADTVFAPGRLRDLIGRYSFVFCYCSVYGEDCDEAHFGTAPPANACSF